MRIRQAERIKNYQGGSRQSDQDYHDVRMYETDVNSLLDPVNSYAFYISKLNPGIDPLFQTPKRYNMTVMVSGSSVNHMGKTLSPK